MNQSEMIVLPGAGRVDYGRFELRSVLQRNYLLGFGISVLLHSSILGGYHLVQLLSEEEIPTVKIRIMKYSDLGPPPSIVASSVPPPISVATATAKPSIGVPVPVPDTEVSPEQTIATQSEMNAEPSPATEEFGEGQQIEFLEDIIIDDDEPAMDEFVPVEKLPQIVKRVLPEYPEMAVRAGLEGTVWVKILVDKEGKPRKAVVVRSTAELFDQPAIDAAMGFLFTPAVMNNGPVKVWVSFPFKFQLKVAKHPS